MEHVEAHTMRLLGKGLSETMKSSSVHFFSGDILYGRLRPYLNKVLRPEFEGLCSAEFIVFPKSPDFIGGFLQYRLNATDFLSFASHLNEGDRPRVDFDQIGKFFIRLPPVPEQRRIVVKIEELFSDLDAGVAALQRVKAKLKRYRAAVLKAAVEGKLTAEWRKKNRAKETGQQLLDRILVERRRKWEEEQLAGFEKAGKKPAAGWKDKYKEPVGVDESTLAELPDGWCWATAEQCCEYLTKGTTPARDELFADQGDIPFIKIYNLTKDGSLNFDVNPTFISSNTHNHSVMVRSHVYPGDVLMNIVGPPLGKVSIVPDLFHEWNVNQAIAIFRPLSRFDRKFLCHLLLTEQILSWATKQAKATAGQFNLTLEIVRRLPLPMPPEREQQEIAKELDRRLSLVRESEVQINANLKRSARLRQSILKRAFEGKLVPQDPNDEPASVLLDRIKAGSNNTPGRTNTTTRTRLNRRSSSTKQQKEKA